jgi:hypothetical protein
MVSHTTYSLATKIAHPLRMIYTLFGLLVSALLLASCGGGAGTVGTPTGKSLYSTAPAAVSIVLGSTVNYEIGGGTATYKASSSNASVASVEVKGTTLSVKGLLNGTAQIVISDAAGAQVGFNVTIDSGNANVDLFLTAPNNLTLTPGISNSYMIGGGRPAYFVSSSNTAIATVGINNNSFFISGIKAGTAQIIVVDSAGTAVTLSVAVGTGDSGTNLFTTAGNSLTLAVGTPSTYVIGGGAAPYSSTSSNPSVITAKVSNGTSLELTPIAPGSTQVTVYDGGGNSITIGVAVTATTTGAIDVQPNGASGNVGDGLRFLVNGGKPPYAITVNNTSIASVAPATLSSSGGDFVATLRNVGSTVVTITDSSGQIKEIALTASQINTILRLSPSPFLLSEDNKDIISLNIFGGTGPYRAFTSDQRLSSVSVVGSVLNVDVGSNRDRCFTPFDTSGVRVPFGTFDVTITVLDSLGAAATSTMTLKDNGRGDGVTLPLCG